MLRSLHRPIPLYIPFIPIWVTVLAVPAKVAWATLRDSQNGNNE